MHTLEAKRRIPNFKLWAKGSLIMGINQKGVYDYPAKPKTACSWLTDIKRSPAQGFMLWLFTQGPYAYTAHFLDESLINRFDLSGPRYTSHPTTP